MTAAAAPAARADRGPGTCSTCRHFAGTAREVEERLPGLRALGSMDGSVRGADGLCRLHDRYLAASSRCDSFAARDAGPRRTADA